MGLTVPAAVRMLLTRADNEDALPLEVLFGSEAQDAWFRNTVLPALSDTRQGLSDEEVQAYFAARRIIANLRTDSSTSYGLLGPRSQCRIGMCSSPILRQSILQRLSWSMNGSPPLFAI